MKTRILYVVLAIVLAAMLLISCGSKSTPIPEANNGQWVPTLQSGNVVNFDASTPALSEWVQRQTGYVSELDAAAGTHINTILVEGKSYSIHMGHNQQAWQARLADTVCWGTLFVYQDSLHGDLILPADSTIVEWNNLDNATSASTKWITLRSEAGDCIP
ncbi:hypothetical protein M0R04_03645 [Candidatus Dojkabacteria bacterium]|jgi:hypothetical protein|nr:hypothetical protein [Candidatus Dojkabacteria bacterium]